MGNLVLGVVSSPYPSITNRIRASVAKNSDPTVLIQTIIDTTALHPSRAFNFVGLDRDNYVFYLDEIDGGGAVVNNLVKMYAVPSAINGFLTRAFEQIKVGVTPGLVTNATTFVFDGTAGKPDYRNWTPNFSEVGGVGFLTLSVDYSWDAPSGTFALLQTGDKLQANQVYNVTFNNIPNQVTDSVSQPSQFITKEITTDYDVILGDLGNKILINPSTTYLEVSLPDLSTVQAGVPIMFETGGRHQFTVNFIPAGADIIDFLDGTLMMCCNESIKLYKYVKIDLSQEWRIYDAVGNFNCAGEIVSDDTKPVDVINKVQADGSVLSSKTYARLYHMVSKLSNYSNFDTWSSGTNIYRYSRADSINPLNTDKFHVPLRVDCIDRDTGASFPNSGSAITRFLQSGTDIIETIISVNKYIKV